MMFYARKQKTVFGIPKIQGIFMILIKYSPEKVGCVIPLHKELKIGTIRSILRQAKITEEEIEQHL